LKELMGDGQISCTGEDGLASVEMLIGAHISSQRGSLPVELPLAVEEGKITVPFT